VDAYQRADNVILFVGLRAAKAKKGMLIPFSFSQIK
jgi:hypothetical protein